MNRTIVPRSLFVRTMLIVITPIVVLQIVIAVIFYNRHLDTVTRWLSTNVATSLVYVAQSLDMREPGEREQHLVRARDALDLSLEVIAANGFQPGRFGLSRDSIPMRHIDDKIVEAFESKLDRPFLIDLRPSDPAVIEIVMPLRSGSLRALVPKRRITSTSTMLLLSWMVITAAVLSVIAIYYMKLQVMPIRRLAKAVSDFGKGRDEGDFAPEGPSEIRNAAAAYNRMRKRILRHISQRTELLAAVSHDLRTPLTRMKLELELLETDDSEIRAGLSQDVDEMTELVDLYLSFARGEGSETVEIVPLAPIVETMAERAERAGIEVRRKLDQGIELPIRPLAFRRCLANIVDNACGFGSMIELRLKSKDDHVDIVIEDNGPGVPEDKRDAIRKPFVTLESSRRRQEKGVGLGLAIAHDIILGHGGELLLSQSKWGGLKVILRIPN